MEPKDLKNSEELKSTENVELKKTEQNVVSEDVEKVEETTQPEETVTDVKEETTEPVVEAEKQTEEVEAIEKEVVETAEVEEKQAEEKVETPVEAEKEEIAEETVADVKEESAEPVVEAEKQSEEVEAIEEKVVETAEIEEKQAEEKVETQVEAEKEEIVEEKVEEAAVAEEVVSVEVKTDTPNEEVASVDAEEKKEEVKAPAAKAEVKEKIKVEKKGIVDYSKYTQIELVNALRGVLGESEDHNVKYEVETIKSVFYKSLNENIESAKKAFVEGGGAEEEFVVEQDPYENDIKDLLRKYRHIRIEKNKKMESEKEENLKLKYEVIEKIKGLINNEESINKTFNDFRDLQRDWRETGLVPQSKMKNLWDTYHFHVENFYDYIKINRELRDLDLKKNLEIKITLCENAEELLVEPSIIKAFNTLQKFHERWREVGPVPREQKDDIWERFKAATSKINKKHQELFETRKEEQKKNLLAKSALCEQVEEVSNSEVANFEQWDTKSKELVELQKVWRTIGFAPKKDNNKIYERFRNACDKFFDAKREFYAKNKELQQNNLQLKIDLCVQAESLKDSADWKKTTQDFINIQKKWKEIGPIPRKHSDSVWKRFRAACDFFFDKKSEHFSGMDNEQMDNLKKKEVLIEQVTNFESAGTVDENLNLLKGFQRQWTEVGHVPYKKKDEIQVRFREAINQVFDDLKIDDEKRNLLKFRSKMNSYSESNRGQNKMRMERDKYMNKLKQLESDHILLENNIGFFAKSKNAEGLIADIKNKIEMSKQKIELLKDKIRVIDEMDNE
jgi:hypothetical protein